MTNLFDGLSVALATPFQPDASLDLDGFRRLVRHVVTGGVDVLVVLGTTGEAPTLDDRERDALIDACLEESQGRPVVVGAGSNDTRKAAALARRAQDLGAAGALIVSPYYNKPTPRGLVAHFAAVADAAPGLPLIAYNVPGRTGVNITPAVLARLWENPQVVAVKESTANLAQIGEIARTLPEGRTLLSGDDNMALPSIAVGASGLVSVLANLVPAETKALVEAARRGDLAQARRLHYRLLPLMDALFLESSPIPLKAGLKLMGLAGDTLRLPLAPAEPATVARMAETLGLAGLIPFAGVA
ncbi:MAG TPA: 4-hydroxy-tetrahydrodipicolinate synthase [Holophaga sp.]|nr:4-hydroxy-tetrahydrodipicolinate synthase [Holophaga sp.]